MAYIYKNGKVYAGGGGGASGTPIPTADTVAEFDEDAHINSEDMSSQDVEDFVDGLEAQGANLADYVVEQGTNYRKWNSGVMEQWGIEASASASAHAVYFPKAFISTDYIVVCSNTSGTQANFMPSSTNVAYFYVYPTASVRLYWIAIGKWK